MGKLLRPQKAVQNYRDACMELAFRMQKMLFDGRDFYWVGDEIGGLCDFGDTDFLTPEEMVLIIEHKMPYKDYAEWRNYNIENEEKPHINLRSWLMGMRPEMLDNHE